MRVAGGLAARDEERCLVREQEVTHEGADGKSHIRHVSCSPPSLGPLGGADDTCRAGKPVVRLTTLNVGFAFR